MIEDPLCIKCVYEKGNVPYYNANFVKCKGGTVNITVDDVTDEVYAELKGITNSEDKEVTDNSENEAPEIGYGHIVTKIYNGVKSFKVEFLPRIQITKITADRKTKGESLAIKL